MMKIAAEVAMRSEEADKHCVQVNTRDALVLVVVYVIVVSAPYTCLCVWLRRGIYQT